MQLDGLTLFGLLSLSAMLVFYALEHRSHWYVLAMAGACIAASIIHIAAPSSKPNKISLYRFNIWKNISLKFIT